ncbi:MAG TPA: DUF3565 domain-containing protein [Gemmatimonadales bacterium]
MRSTSRCRGPGFYPSRGASPICCTGCARSSTSDWPASFGSRESGVGSQESGVTNQPVTTLQQPIAGFHQDEDGHWVAELACGHQQHVRHDPPWQVRSWVITEEGRRSRLGTTLECPKCDGSR